MALSVGDKAPDFTLVGSDTKEVNLADYKGQNVLLLFFPFAFTSVCTAELCSTRDDIAFYQGMDAQVLGISVDSPFTLAKFKEEQNLNFPLLSDFNKSASQAYGAYYDDFFFGLQGVSKRSAFVLDKNGVVRYAEVLDNAGDLPNFEKIKAALEALN